MSSPTHNVDDGSFHSFQPEPGGRVHALGLTYADHIRETGEKPGQPVIFRKTCAPTVLPRELATPASAALLTRLAGLDAELAAWLEGRFGALPALLDYEVELGMVLLDGCTQADIAAGRLPRVGFFLANDVTARSVQIAGQGSKDRLDFWSASKSLPGFLPVADQYWCAHDGAPLRWPAVTLQTRVNGELRQSAPSSNLILTPQAVLALACSTTPDGRLHEGELILTGTPAGVALSVPRWKRRIAELLPRRVAIGRGIAGNCDNPKFLRPGDVVEVSADWLGRFAMTIV